MDANTSQFARVSKSIWSQYHTDQVSEMAILSQLRDFLLSYNGALSFICPLLRKAVLYGLMLSFFLPKKSSTEAIASPALACAC